VLGALALVATAADGRPPTEPIYIDTVDVAVEIYSFHYVPAIISVPSGAHVTWTNHDPEQHTATRADGTWDTGLMSLDGTGQITFETPGVYHYTCTLHPHMHGEITVRP
jgi:plastocyanin